MANNSGGLIGINSYDAFGIPDVGNIGRFQYTGQTWLPEIGLYYYKARMYSPTLSRFLQTDPIGYGDGLNLYNYVGSDPVNNTDPTGLQTACIVEVDQETLQPTGRRVCSSSSPHVGLSPLGGGGGGFSGALDCNGVSRHVTLCAGGGGGGGGGGVDDGLAGAVVLPPGALEAAKAVACEVLFTAEDGEDTFIAELGVGGGFTFGPIGITLNGGLAIDGTGEVGLVGEAGSAFGVGVSEFGGVRVGLSVGPGIDSLAETSLTSSTTVAAVVGGSVDVIASVSGEQVGVGAGVGGGAGFGANSAVTATSVTSLFNAKDLLGC